MKIKRINPNPLYNEEHYQFYTQFTNLINPDNVRMIVLDSELTLFIVIGR